MILKKIAIPLAFLVLLYSQQSAAQSVVHRNDLLVNKPPALEKDYIYGIKKFKYAQIRTWQYKLKNGVTIVFRADDSQNDIVFKALGPGGASLVNEANFQSAVHAGGIVANSALGNLTAAQLKSLMVDNQINIAPHILPTISTIDGRFPLAGLETVLQIINLYFARPQKDKDAFATYIKGLSKVQTEHDRNPYAVFQDSISRALDGGQSLSLNQKNIHQINVDSAYAAFNKCFGNANGFTFIFSGKLMGNNMNEPDQLAPIFIQYLQALPSSPLPSSSSKKNTVRANKGLMKNKYYSNGSLSALNLTYEGQYVPSDSLDLQFKALTYLLTNRLNGMQEFGNTNKAKVTLLLDKGPKAEYRISIALKCKPGYEDRIVAALTSAVDVLHTQVQEIKTYIDQRKRELKVDTFNYLWWADYLATQYMYAEDPEIISHYPYNFYKVTPESIKKVARTYLTNDHCRRFVLFSRNKKKQ